MLIINWLRSSSLKSNITHTDFHFAPAKVFCPMHLWSRYCPWYSLCRRPSAFDAMVQSFYLTIYWYGVSIHFISYLIQFVVITLHKIWKRQGLYRGSNTFAAKHINNSNGNPKPIYFSRVRFLMRIEPADSLNHYPLAIVFSYCVRGTCRVTPELEIWRQKIWFTNARRKFTSASFRALNMWWLRVGTWQAPCPNPSLDSEPINTEVNFEIIRKFAINLLSLFKYRLV